MARCDSLVAIDILGGVEILTQLESFMECDVACRFQAIAKAFRTCAVCHFTRCGLILSRSKAEEVVARMDVSKVQSVSLRNGHLAKLLFQAYAAHVSDEFHCFLHGCRPEPMLAKKLDTLARYMAWPRPFNSEDTESENENGDYVYFEFSPVEFLIMSNVELLMQRWFRSDPTRWSANIVASLLRVAIKICDSCTGRDRMRFHIESNN